MKIQLLSFEKDTGLADFEVSVGTKELVTCHADVDLCDFMSGGELIKPYAWFDMEEQAIDRPDWFTKQSEITLNQVFEESFREFMK